MSGSLMRRPSQTSHRTFYDAAFILNTRSFYQIFLILTFPLSSTVRVRSHCVASQSLCGIPVTCPSVIIQEFYSNMHGFDTSIPHFITHVRGTYIVVTPNTVSEVLHAPKVVHPDYPNYDRLRTVSKDELPSLFCETPLSWGDRQNTACSGFLKGPRFLNIVMTFVLHPLSHYNSITEPCAPFLLSLLEGITIDFPSHFILSLIDVYRDTKTRDKLIFPGHVCHRCGCHQME